MFLGGINVRNREGRNNCTRVRGLHRRSEVRGEGLESGWNKKPRHSTGLEFSELNTGLFLLVDAWNVAKFAEEPTFAFSFLFSLAKRLTFVLFIDVHLLTD